MDRKTIYSGIAGLFIGVLANSVDMKVHDEFRFNNPIPKKLSASPIENSILSGQEIQDYEVCLDIFGKDVALIRRRAVWDPVKKEYFIGDLDKEGNIHSKKGLYILQKAHGSQWYQKKI